MNTNPNAKTVLCFGDSNTWGQPPDKAARIRADERWTGILQRNLGDDYYVIEEGLGGRTVDREDSRREGRNGMQYLKPCLDSHSPLDYMIIMLGTNDLKVMFKKSADDIAGSLRAMVKTVQTYTKERHGQTPQIILVSPIIIDDHAPRFEEFYTGYYDVNSAQQSQKLANVIGAVSQEMGCLFFDAKTCAEPGEEGLHFSRESHKSFADAVTTSITRQN